MQKSILSIVALGVAATWASQENRVVASSARAAVRQEAAASTLQGEVVGVESEAKRLKLKVQSDAESATELALLVEGEAVAALAELKAGDRVTATCREGTSGESCVVTSLKKD
jgi:hypothetical protein